VAGRVVVLGGGAAGEAFVAELRKLDQDVPITLVERERVGGECTYWACMPSKTLLRSPEIVAAARRAPGAAEAVTGELDAERIFWWRDQIVDGFDDSAQAEWLEKRGVELVRGEGRVRAPGVVVVDERELAYDALVVATGSAPSVPPVPGLEGLPFWTSRDATSAREVPASLAVLGGGAVGCELAQLHRRLGTEVDLIQIGPKLLPREDGEAGGLLAECLADEGVRVHTCTKAEAVECSYTDCFHLRVPGGEDIRADRLLIATGRRPRVDGLGLEALGARLEPQGVVVDERLRAADGVWAVGDVTGVALFTHVGKYQGRVAARDLAGQDVRADYRAVPAVTFTDPQVASVGRTDGEGAVSSKREAASRHSTYERPKRKLLVKLFADPERRVLVGATIVGPEAGEWLGQLTLAVRAETPVEILRETIQPYPTFSEAIHFAVRDLPL
jgi:pyruvate/2-oxoglutarate dehydrogenase complex dihydrolipoamide dehydrogenase (E3) component